MHEVCRAVHGVDDPRWRVREGGDASSIRARFLHQRKAPHVRRLHTRGAVVWFRQESAVETDVLRCCKQRNVSPGSMDTMKKKQKWMMN